jgi:heat shock protein HslJ
MALAYVGLVTLLALSSTQNPSNPDKAPVSLEGTAWNAVELSGMAIATSPASERQPHLVFGKDGRVSGADGCNRVTGPYTVKANGITFGELASTQMACPKTEDVERRFRSALKGTSHWNIVKNRLQFYGATGKPLAVFERRPPATPTGAAALQGTRWQLVKFQGGDDRTLTPDDPTKYTIEFMPGGQIAAQIDCNRGRGTWKATPSGQLEFGSLALTRAMCPEGSLHDHLAKQWTFVRSFVIKDGHLFLSLMADGGIYEFAPIAAKKP